MAQQTPRISGRTSGLAATRQNMPNEVGQTAHHQWEVAQFLYRICQTCLIPREMGTSNGQNRPYLDKHPLFYHIFLWFWEWAKYNMLYGIFLGPTQGLEGNCQRRLTTRA
jgi:hypothetical protein